MHPLIFIALEGIFLIILWIISPFIYIYSPVYTPITKAVAVTYPTKGNNVRGVVKFIQEQHGVRVIADISGLTPGNHGIHIHEFGDCACDDGVCAGSHFNPTKQPHGGLKAEHRHVGDFGNIEADADGQGHLEFIDKHLTLNGKNSIIGRSIIIHEKEDDLETQPSGNSGNRIACGTIGIAPATAKEE